jgi:radical SAM superfamily enzyme YgiQ (UPF0313 family)
MKVTLIYPRWREGLWSIFIYRMPMLGLNRLAELTPEDVSVEIIDENLSEIDYSYADLVGISVMTPAAPRAYEIAKRYRELGAKVVFGGIHPSTLPEEGLQHADSVVIGEADDLWPWIVEDARNGRLRQRYVASHPPDITKTFTRLPSTVDRSRYFIKNFLQTGRGCPVNCNFCSVTAFNGATMRYRDISDVVREVEAKRHISKIFMFADDNLVAHGDRAKALFEAIAPLEIEWGSQVTIKLALEKDLLPRAVKSGCRGAFIGFESIDQHSLDFCEKKFKVQKYETAIRRLHDYGIFITGSFIFGFDSDTPDVVKRTLDFCMKNRLDMCQFSILTPFPDTRLYGQFVREGRIVTHDWKKYDAFHVVYKPKLMTEDELQRAVNDAYKEYYGFLPTMSRMLSTIREGHWRNALLSAKTSWDSYGFDI